MNLELLYHAIDRVRGSRFGSHSREATFLRTYPVLLSAARLPVPNPVDDFLRLASLAYAWMPQALRLETAHLAAAAHALDAARDAAPLLSEPSIDAIAGCLGSLVGAAKVLHLANPAVFPLWDPRVERLRLQEAPTAYHMGQSSNYLRFIAEVRDIAAHPLFLTFHHEYCTAYQARLQCLKIPAYPLTEPRVIESAATELAGG
ncbi:hypothetical protein CCR95_09610 [Thiocystis minor]|uniref:hypothetical protein n=1 Tax=Thiocystis minor TaxID=61597 RepID=UPI001913A5AE|nr:hypothetical protein [Thiocystis minor]MBK5964336.1 hypothetical protein [Thiocystis minor]